MILRMQYEEREQELAHASLAAQTVRSKTVPPPPPYQEVVDFCKLVINYQM